MSKRAATAISTQNSLIFPDIFSRNATHFPPIFPGIPIISFDGCGVWKSLDPIFAVQNVGSIKCGTTLQNDCTEQNAINKGKIWQFSHSTGCVSEYRESHFSKMKQ